MIGAQKMIGLGILIRRIDFLTMVIMIVMILSSYGVLLFISKLKAKLKERRRNRDDKRNA